MMTSIKDVLRESVLDLKKINRLVPKFMKQAKTQKKLLKAMAKVWSEDEDSRRVLAFVNIAKALNCQPECFSLCIKVLFMAYVRNSKFVLGSTVAQINFMRQSLVELFANNLDETYIHGFVYIRQLAITLRKAYTSHTKDDLQAVTNWQFVNSLRLWTDFVSRYHTTHELIQSLIHPLVQLIVGTAKICGGERWLPLRFHCVTMLHNLAGVPVYQEIPNSNTTSKIEAIPLVGHSLQSVHRMLLPNMPLLLDVFRVVDFNRKASTASRSPMDLRLLLHFSPSQRRETASSDAIVSWLIDLLTECMAIQATSVCFPEYALPVITELRQFVRTCRVAAFTRQMKALLVKICEHSDWVLKCRRRVRSLSNNDEILTVESSLTVVDDSGNLLPFWDFYVRHKELRVKELAQLTESNKKDSLSSESKHQDKSRQVPGRSGSDDDDDDDDDDSDSSDASYDIDDGKTITHVSKSKKSEQQEEKKKNKSEGDKTAKENDFSGSESDFDLNGALNEDEDMRSETSEVADEITDFELDDSGDDDEDQEEEEEEGSGDEDDETGSYYNDDDDDLDVSDEEDLARKPPKSLHHTKGQKTKPAIPKSKFNTKQKFQHKLKKKNTGGQVSKTLKPKNRLGRNKKLQKKR